MLGTNPIHLAAAVAIALSGTVALAQTSGGTSRTVPAGTASSTSGNTTGGSTTPTPGVTADSSVGSQPTTQGTPGPSSASSAQGTGTVPSDLNGTGAVVIPGDTGFAGNPSQQNIVIQQQPAPQPEVRTLSTPLLDQTVREAQSRETRRRNARQEPRIIGIAPNTDRDLTHQMPDDPIIRY